MNTDTITEAIYRSRLVWTRGGELLHLRQPVRIPLTLCGRRVGWPALAANYDTALCKQCRTAFEHELYREQPWMG